ncbi:MAG: ATP-binding protein, partial [Natronospirillum sp.]
LELLSDSRQNPAQSKHIARMQDDIDEMNDMTDELLHYARIERSGVSDDWHAVAPNAFMDYLLAKLDREPGNRSLTIEVSAHLPAMVINRVQMERAIGNVIRNALKYSDGRVHVTLAEQNGTFSCVVDDDGPGIPVEARERVFEPFARLDAARDRASGGHGLGLAIARQIIHGHQGSMHCEDSPLGGARFCISFPVLRET